MATRKTRKTVKRPGGKPVVEPGRAAEEREPVQNGVSPDPASRDTGPGKTGPEREAPPKHLPRPTRR